MKPQSFDYFRAASVEEAISLLVQEGEDSKVLAGGQSLLPMMNFRLARPTALIDVAHIDALRGISMTPSDIRIGSMTRHLELENSTVSGPMGSLLRQSAGRVGHLPIRTRGTIGGSLVHSDPSSEWCMLATLMDAEVSIEGPRGLRKVAAHDFFVTYFTTAIEFDELLIAVEFPQLSGSYRVAVQEFARRAGDFAIVGIMTAFSVNDGVIADPRIAVGGVADRVLRLSDAESALVGKEPTEENFSKAATIAMGEVNPAGDLHGPPEFRRDLVKALTRRALAGASA
jgi:carbon-monoxide dehydrogenase medium subunit